jgi:phosphatidylglycerol:prolipoprotein diacylglycerol transferase
MMPILFRLPIGQDGIPVYGFGMMLFITFIATTWMASRRAEKVGIAREVLQDLAVWIFIGGIIGARIVFLITVQGMRDPWEILKALPRIWDGGIVFYGAVEGALVAYAISFWLFFRHKENVTTLRLADVVAPTVALGLLLGRIGCFLNGCCYGAVACPTCACVGVPFPLSSPARHELVQEGYQTAAGFLLDENAGVARVLRVEPGSAAEEKGLKAGDVITQINGRDVKTVGDVDRLLAGGWPRGQEEVQLTVDRGGTREELAFRPRTLPLLPTQIYESISMGLLLLLLFAFEPFKRRDGQVMALMMIGYGVHRYFNELLRSDQRPEGFEKYTSIVLAAAGLAMMLWLWLAPGPAPAPAPPSAEKK